MHLTFEPTRAAGLARLAGRTPGLGWRYADGRNTDRGPDTQPAATVLSPWLRHRLVLEEEVVDAALAAHGPAAAEKLVQEVFWRAYFKGWLEARPGVWARYRDGLADARQRLETSPGLRKAFDAARGGRTGIDCFDAWAGELHAHHWLHNHTRMWFASIWIFTLRLPWQLGAELFLEQLVDGDPAANTLSWRWVGGLHTRGKHYVARADNIARYTAGRFHPRGQLDEAPDPLPLDEEPPATRVTPPAQPPAGDVLLLVHEDDLGPETLPLDGLRVRGIAGLPTRAATAVEGTDPAVAAFARGGLEDALARAAARFGAEVVMLDGPAAVRGWAGPVPVVAAYAPVGPTAQALRDMGVPLVFVQRPWDGLSWPHATRGYSQLKARIPSIVADLGLG